MSLVTLLLVVALAPARAQGAVVPTTAAPNPLAGRPFYVDPNTWAAWAVSAYPASAETSRFIAGAPQARWLGDWISTSRVAADVDAYLTAATRAKAQPVLVLYAIPHRDCGGYSAGGLTSAEQYLAWVRQVRRGLADRRVALILEPDALAAMDCLSPSLASARTSMLRQAVGELVQSPQAAIYVDAGHSRWLSPATLANRLQAVGVQRTRGFSLNVSNFYATAEETAYGEHVVNLLGGGHYLVDTSRNGRGPAPDAPLNWCNPGGRGLGALPTTQTEAAHADAYLWVKHPGESDGDCGRGEPVSGRWFNDYALGLVARRAYF